MIQILQNPTSTTFIESMYDLIYETDEASIDVTISCDGAIRRNMYYANENGEVIVRLRDIIRDMAMETFSVSDMSVTHKTRGARRVSVSAEGGPTILFIALDGGYSATHNVTMYMDQWMTVSRADRSLPFTMPAYLQFYSYNKPKLVIAEAEMQDGTEESAVMCEVDAEMNVQVNCKYDMLASLFGENPGAVTLYIADEDMTKLSKGIRFVAAKEVSENEDIYYYRNCMGAIEHLNLRGSRASLSKKSEKIYENGWREQLTIGEPAKRSYRKNTGYNARDKMAKELRAFMESEERYVYKDRLMRPISIEESNYNSSTDELRDIEFEYSILGDAQCVEIDIV